MRSNLLTSPIAVTAAAGIALFSTLSIADIPLVDAERFNDFLHARLDDRTKAYSFALVNRDGTVVQSSRGWAQEPGDGGVRMTNSIVSNIGSVSKLITGVALLHLLREQPIVDGTVSQQLNQQMRNYLPSGLRERFGGDLRGLTLRHLLQHKSGFPGYQGDKGFTVPSGKGRLEHVLDLGTAGPGDKRQYHNENLSVMRFIIPKIAYPTQTAFIDTSFPNLSGTPYYDAVRVRYERLYDQYMQEVFFPKIFSGKVPVCNPHDQLGPKTMAKSYSSTIDRKGDDFRPDNCAPQGGFYMSIRQLTQFARVYGYTNTLVGKGIRRRMERPSNLDDRLVFNKTQSGNHFVEDTAGGLASWVTHGGSYRGYAAAFIKLPDGHYGVALANSPNISSLDLSHGLYYAFVYATIGLPAEHISSNDRYHFAYRQGTYVTRGASNNHDSGSKFVRGSLGQGNSYADIFDISANDWGHFTWFKDQWNRKLTVMAGTSTDLDSKRDIYESDIAEGFLMRELIHVSSNDNMHFGWYHRGFRLYVSAGTSDDLDSRRKPKTVRLSDGKTPDNIVAIVSNDKMHFAFYDDCTYSAGTSTDLRSKRDNRSYDCANLSR